MEEIIQLQPLQKATLDLFLSYSISKLSARTINGLKTISPELCPDELYETISQPGFEFNSIRNIGESSVEEYSILINELVSFVHRLRNIEALELNKTYIQFFILKTFLSHPDDFVVQINQLIDDDNRLKLFAFLNYLVDSDFIFNKIEKDVFKLYYTNETPEDFDRYVIADHHNITEERVRQIKVELEDDLHGYFSFVQNINMNLFGLYGIDGTNPFYTIDDTFANIYNEQEEVNFKNVFYGIIKGISLKDTHVVLGHNQIITGASNGQIRFKNIYILKNELFYNFQFLQFLRNISSIQNRKIEKTKYLDLRAHMVEYLHANESRNYIEELIQICKIMIEKEFELNIDQYDYIIFKRNTRISIPDLCYEIFEEVSHPLNLDQLIAAVNGKNPNFNPTADGLRSGLNKQKDRFIYFSRTSTYGLRKWENEQDNIMGGTISDIVEKFLKKSKRPRHVEDILKYVQKYRPETNIKSLIPNLKLEKGKRFKFYSGQYVGLKSNSYRDRKFKVKKIVGFHFKSIQFEKMIGWNYNNIVKHYIETYGYDRKGVTFIIDRKIREGKLSFSKDMILERV